MMDVVYSETRKRNRDAVTLNDASFSQQVNVAKVMSSGTEYGDNRRAKAYVTRLHQAKYLKCDALLKELFFPTLTMAKRFGFCSTSGIDARGAGFVGETGADLPVTNAKASGVYRGIAMFTLRSQTQAVDSAESLNATRQRVGTSMITGSSESIYTAYRRFNSRPPTAPTSLGNGNWIANNIAPTVQFSQLDGTSAWAPNTLYVPQVGDINVLETKAVQSTNFQHALGSTTPSEGTTSIGTADGQTGGANWNGSGSVINSNGRYYANLKNTTIRISDGYLEMDITNGKSTSTFIEIVIHAFKKNAKDIGTQELMNAIYNSVQYQQTDRNVAPYFDSANTEQNPGGWQAFWDPTYPFLGCKAQHRKSIDAIAREVHRSAHMLGPGQSKLVKIHLGSLYYDLGSKCENPPGNGNANTPFSFENPANGVGSLNISVGHSGVMQLSAPVNPAGGPTGPQFQIQPDTYNASSGAHTYTGGGFWVGKTFCPSEIVVSGNYVEKFYPGYVVDKERRNWSDKPLLPPSVSDTVNGTQYALPAALPVMDTIGTIPMQTNAVPAQVTSQNSLREEL